MALNEIFTSFFPKIFSIFRNTDNRSKFLNWKYIFYLFLVFLFLLIFILISNLISQKNKAEKQNLNSLIGSKEFSIFPNRSKRYACASVQRAGDFLVPAWVPRGRCPYKNWNEMEVPEKLQLFASRRTFGFRVHVLLLLVVAVVAGRTKTLGREPNV